MTEHSESDRKLFIGYCWGNAGTGWLARLLNSHEDIFCVHAPNFPRFDPFIPTDTLEFIGAIFKSKGMGGAYPIVGLTHGVPLWWHSQMVERFQRHLRSFVLTRHPIKRIQSAFVLNVQGKDSRLADPRWRDAFAQVFQELVKLAGHSFPDDYESLAFYRSCYLVNTVVQETEMRFPIYRFEDLLEQEGTLQELVAFISDGTCQLSSPVIRKMRGTVVGAHAQSSQTVEEIYASWQPYFRDAYHLLVTSQSLALYQALGYRFPRSSPSSGETV